MNLDRTRGGYATQYRHGRIEQARGRSMDRRISSNTAEMRCAPCLVPKCQHGSALDRNAQPDRPVISGGDVRRPLDEVSVAAPF
jgi:hypothetical protein